MVRVHTYVLTGKFLSEARIFADLTFEHKVTGSCPQNSTTYSHHSIKRTGSIKRPGLIFFKKSLLNVPYDQKNKAPNILSYCLY